jgi:hypothetical protein
MDGPSRSRTARPGRRRAARLALLAVGAVLSLTAAPGVAAATTATTAGSVVPLLDCIRANGNGTWTALFGYDNRTRSTVTIPVGPDNKLTPTSYGAPQPTTFAPGVHHGVFVAPVTRGAGPMWHLDRTNLAARAGSGPACPGSTELPQEGNGTGAAIALAVAGAVGAVAVHRARRRALDGTGLPAGTGHDDA